MGKDETEHDDEERVTIGTQVAIDGFDFLAPSSKLQIYTRKLRLQIQTVDATTVDSYNSFLHLRQLVRAEPNQKPVTS